MKLLGDGGVADVTREDVVRDSWNVSARECGVQILISQTCSDTPTEIALIGDDTSAPGEFKAVSFPVLGFFRRGRFCEQPDDLDWFDDVFETNLELVATWALTVDHAAGSDSWTNGTGVQTVSLAATPTDAQQVAAIEEGRRLWLKTVSTRDKSPIMHVPPKLAPMLKVQGVLDNADRNIWGDRVVIGQGYDEHPQVFWTGPIGVHIGARTTEATPKARTNDELTASDQMMALVIPPCSIVRVGSYA